MFHPEPNRSWSDTHLVILNVTEGGAKDLLYLEFKIGAERRSTKAANSGIVRQKNGQALSRLVYTCQQELATGD